MAIRRRVVIMGAAGRDFHNFNVVYRSDPAYRVVAFTAAQIPGIAHRRYPPALAGPLYPEGIAIVDESGLEELIRREAVDETIFAYSDVLHEEVMHRASRALAAGSDFVLLGPKRTMLKARLPAIAVSAVRTGSGKSQVSRHLSRLLRERGRKVAVIRHPMPYGDLEKQAVQRFATRADLERAHCTIEEREEYEPHIAVGTVVFAGVDYEAILGRAEAEADVVLWDGGNNDFPFLKPDLHIVLADALRPGHETAYHPGETCLRMADVVVIAKSDAARPEDVARIEAAVRRANPKAEVVRGASPVTLDDPQAIKGKRVLVIEDGPTLTHGGMAFGAGCVAARAAGAVELVDPRPFAAPALSYLFDEFPHLGAVLPAMGYGPEQVEALAATINASDAELVVSATPIDLLALVSLNKPVVRARYEYADAGKPTVGSVLDGFLGKISASPRS
ncbi:MAG TPA: cyclic 2,3-diphosphoglycerate synthase [Alphaproteobacteria bacterium]|nr:cyclic 2,3-diphosphoglycerate synthase [Alphaproteobacteria bacterium]